MELVNLQPAFSLDAVLCTSDLRVRPSRAPDRTHEGRRLAAVVREIKHSPTAVLRRAAAEALLFCGAHSAGVSVLADAHEFRRPVIVGPLACYSGSRASSTFSPYGVVVSQNRSQLFREPARYYRYLADLEPAVFEVLLAPLLLGRIAVGALWVVSHDEDRVFDAEDERRLTSLAEVTSAAFEVAEAMVGSRPAIKVPAHERALSRREEQVCRMVAQGFTNGAIAETLNVNDKTVATYRARVTDKLGFRNRADFVMFAVTQGWLERS